MQAVNDHTFLRPLNDVTVPLLSLQDVKFGYAGRTIIEIKNLEIRPGERVSLVGPSGCGKTTVLATIAGMNEPIKGQLLIQGASHNAFWRARNTARTLQNFPLFHWLTVKQNLLLACRIRKVKPIYVDEILDQFSATKFAHCYPKTLSGGERCRASLAQAVVANPKLLLMDEPFTGLDTIVKEDVAASLFRFADLARIGVLLVTHDLNDAVEFSDRVLVAGGKLPTRVLAEVSTAQPFALQVVREALRRDDVR